MPIRKKALYFSPVRRNYDDFSSLLDRQEWITADGPGVWSGRDLALNFDLTENVDDVLERISGHYYNMLVLDCRLIPGLEGDIPGTEEGLRAVLDALAREASRERAYPFARIVVLVGEEETARVDELIFNLGERHVGGCIRDLSLSPHVSGDAAEEARDLLISRFWDFCRDALLEQRSGKKAICAAGGGITGIYYELGVLKCLDDAFDRAISSFDMYYGISAGAIVTGLMVNGISLDDMMANLGGVKQDWPEKLRLSWRQLNVRELPRRLLMAHQDFASYLVDAFKGSADLSLFSAIWAYERALGPMFDNGDLEIFMRQLFKERGCTNRFADLDCRLYVGATDQDTREHVLFGDGDFKDVPISKAIQASSAAHPFFRSVRIKGRYYTDGIVTRTSNMKSAISKGADLIFIVDPFLPAVSSTPGFNASHGNLWVVEQDIKTLAFTRFSMVREEVLRRNPQVNAYTFLPSNRMRRLMSQNPFIAQNFHPIVCEAYRSTFRRLRQLEYKMAGELARHGITLDLERVAHKVESLRSSRKPDVRSILDPIAKPKSPKSAKKVKKSKKGRAA